MKKFLAVFLATAMALSMAACGSTASSSASSAKKSSTAASGSSSASASASASKSKTTFGLTPLAKRQTLRVGYFAGSAHSSPFYIADEKGFFKELNIDVEYQPFTNGPAMMEANDSWDVCTTGAAGVLVGMVSYDVKCIGACDYEKNMGLFVRADSKLAGKKAEDWKGSTWLYPTGTNAQMILGGELNKLGLKFDDIKSVNMDISSALTAFKAGQGDGIAVWNAIACSAEDAGFVRVDDAGTLGIKVFNGFCATPDALKNRADLVKMAYEVYYMTVNWLHASDANMKEGTALYLESCENEGIACDESVAKRVMGYFACPLPAEAVQLMEKTSADDAKLYTKRELLQAEKDLLITMDFLKSVGKYTDDDRNKILDKNMMDNTIAKAAQVDFKAAGVM